MNTKNTITKIRQLVLVFIIGLAISGITAIPLITEVGLLVRFAGANAASTGHMHAWLWKVYEALRVTQTQYPFLFYGTDWLAFGHIVIAIVFVGAWQDPVRNRWLFDFGLIACVLVIPWAIVFGAVRGIPFFWRLIDCSFGVFGLMPLWFARKWARQLEQSRGTIQADARDARSRTG